MSEIKHEDMLKNVLAKRRDCIALTEAEQKWVDTTYGQLFEKKFGGRTFMVKTGEEIRKAVGKPSSVQPDAAIAEERSKFHTKDSKIENDDPSGTIKATETGDYVNVDEKKVGGKDDKQTEAEATNASDIIHSDKEDLQRKPVLKFAFGDPVVQVIGKRAIAGVIVQAYPAKEAALVKWSNGTFSHVRYSELEKVADKYAEEKEHEVPITADSSHEVKTPGTDKAKVKKDDSEAEAKEDDAIEQVEDAIEQLEQAQAEEEGNKDDDDTEKAFYTKCEKAVGENPNVTDAHSICMFVRTTMKKSSEKIIEISKEEISKSNPKLADYMEKNNNKSMKFDTEAFEKADKPEDKEDKEVKKDSIPGTTSAGSAAKKYLDRSKSYGLMWALPKRL